MTKLELGIWPLISSGWAMIFIRLALDIQCIVCSFAGGQSGTRERARRTT
jgi:hypothetical protein